MHIGISGAGTMGAGIALTCLYAGLNVTLHDVYPPALDKAKSYIETFLAKKDQLAALDKLTVTDNLVDFAQCDVVIEAVIEQLAVKQAIFKQLDAICRTDTVFATNTSTIAVSAIAATTTYPQRVVGMHFFNPAPVMKLVEVVRAAQTVEASVATVTQLAQTLGKTPVTVTDSPGFLVNRVARPFYLESLRIVTEGIATPGQVDTILQLAGGFRMGVFQLLDVIGLDVSLAASTSVYEQMFHEPRFRPSLLQAKMVQANQLGRKTGRGFYAYDADGKSTFALPTVPPMQPQSGHVYATADSTLTRRFQQAGYTRTDHKEVARIWLMDDASADVPDDVLLWVDVSAAEAVPAHAIGYDGTLFETTQAITLVAGTDTTPTQRQHAELVMNGVGLAVIWLDRAAPGLVLTRILAQIINEAAFTVGEGIADQNGVDTAMQLGMNYPNGPFIWAQAIGYRRVVAVLDALFAYYHEPRYRVAPLLRRLAV